MNSRIGAIIGGLLLPAALAFLGQGVRGLRRRMESASAARDLEKARASGDLRRIEKAAAAVVRRRPRDAPVRLLRARALLAAGKFAEARAAYAEAAKVAVRPRLRAAAAIGRGSARLLKSTPPAPQDIEAAKKAFEEARRVAPRMPDAWACLAVAHAWAGDLKAAEAAAKEAKGTLGLEPAIALACCRAFLAASGGHSAAALEEFRRAQALDPTMRTALGKYLARRVKVFALASGARPGAPKEVLEELVRRLRAEGKQGIANPDTYPLFLQAAFACAGFEGHGRIGMGLLDQAVAARPEDPIPLLFRAVAVARRLASLWEKAGEYAADKGVSKVRENPSLKEMETRDARLARDLTKAAEIYAAHGGDGEGEGAGRAMGIFEYMFRWKLRKAEISTNPAMRRKRELHAAAAALAADRRLGEKVPAAGTPAWTTALAALVRSAGVLFARNSDWPKAYACFVRSLEILPQQPELGALVEKMRQGLEVVAVHPPAPEKARLSRPMVGVELSLPGWLADLSAYKVTVTVGPKDGPRTAITPVASGTGLWYLPGADELPEGLIEARFEIIGPFSRKVEATTSFPVDTSPPKITSRHPDAGAVIGDKHTYIRIKWKDASGLDPDSVEVVLEPVRAQAIRRVLVTKGRQKSGRYTGKVTWKGKSPVVPPEARDSGEIVTGTASEMVVGTYRVKVRMRDAFGRLKEDAWTFTIR